MLSQPRVGALLLCVLLCAGLLVAFLLVDGTPGTQNTPDIPDTSDKKGWKGGDGNVTHSLSHSVSHSVSELIFVISVFKVLQSCCGHM